MALLKYERAERDGSFRSELRTKLVSRRARPEDVDEILNVAHQSWWATYRGFVDDAEIRRRLAEWYSRAEIEKCVRDPGAVFLVAEIGPDIVGYGHLGWSAAGPELFRLYARPDVWRKGIGSSLISKLESELAMMGVTEYWCRVHRGNDIGLAFYLRAGFARDTSFDDTETFGLVRKIGTGSRS